MDPLDHDKHKRKNPFDLVDDEFDQLFNEILQMPCIQENADEFDRLFNEIIQMPCIQEKIEEIFNKIDMLQARNVHVSCIEMRSDGKMSITEFNVHPLKQRIKRDTKIEKRKMVTDIIEDDKEVAVTVELPGVEKEDINLNATEDALEITVDNPKRKYHKLFDLPYSVKPNTMKSTYKNGILDVTIKKR